MALVGKEYAEAGQAGACLHTISILQAWTEADLICLETWMKARGWAQMLLKYSAPDHQGDSQSHLSIFSSPGGHGGASLVKSIWAFLATLSL